MNKQESSEWFKDWFNSPYYHILYNHRDEIEANQFMDRLIGFLNPSSDARLLDLACGRGRHAIFLSKKGVDVTGVDLSKESIRHASAFESDQLHFYVHDMRNLLTTNYFDYVLNLFTSFGYFERSWENQRVVMNMARTLKPGGKLVLDFFNAEHLLDHQGSEEVKEVQGIQFSIRKEVKGERIIKSIQFEAEGKAFAFEEKVMLLKPADFEGYFMVAGLKVCNVFGNYKLDEFDPAHSDRLIYIAEKIS